MSPSSVQDMSGAADPASAVTDMMHETKTTEPTKQQLLNNNLHNQQINNQPINQQQNIQKQAREITQTKKLQKKIPPPHQRMYFLIYY